MTKILTFLRSFQNSPLFANLAIHAWLAAFLVFAFGVKFPTHRALICVVGIVVAAAKEFLWDHWLEIPPQPYKNGAQDFAGYLIGGALAIIAWLL
jgi:hypothetical protein